MKLNLDDTIAAISTPIGESGIGIVRMSGKGALKIADRIFKGKDGALPSKFKTHNVRYGWIVDRRWTKDERRKTRDDKQVIDEVLLTVMRAPKTYTKEDIVEINCHGGIVALRRVLDLVLEQGARLAEPGEFTKRAFLNGRIDLAQAEAVLDIIKAKTDSALKIGVEQLKGLLSNKINKIRNALFDLLCLLEANIDFPEEEIDKVNLEEIKKNLKRIDKELQNILDNSKQGKIFREGMHMVICGKPNVGKSSLLNALLKQERSIVTPIAGTTRDSIEEIIDIKGIPIRIVDTAGIIEPFDLIEKKAVERSKRQIQLADLIILIFDGSKNLNNQDEVLMRRLKKRQTIAVINKIDLKQKMKKEKLSKEFNRIIEISAKKSKNINLLEEAIADLVYQGKISASEPILVANLRQSKSLQKTKKLIEEALNSLDNRLSLEFIAQDIKEAILHLDDILGRRYSEDLLERIFSEFCIGK